MRDPISFAGSGSQPVRHWEKTAAIVEVAMRRCFPHIVWWDGPREDGSALVYLPRGMNRDELLNLARRERVTLSVPGDMENVVELRFGHLEPAEAEEGIARLGRAFISYIEGADRLPGSETLFFVGP